MYSSIIIYDERDRDIEKVIVIMLGMEEDRFYTKPKPELPGHKYREIIKLV